MSPAMRQRVRFLVDVLLIVLALRQILSLCYVWWQRVGYPYDIEWMEGATLISALPPSRLTDACRLSTAAV